MTEEYFKAHISELYEVDPETGCWNWVNGINSQGYGVVWMYHKGCRANRISYSLLKGTIPEGMFVCHKCDNRKCVNPDHLFLGTYADNMKDMYDKGRVRKGEDHGLAKLTTSKVRKILKMLQDGERPVHIAPMFGVCPQAISFIKSGKRWKHVERN